MSKFKLIAIQFVGVLVLLAAFAMLHPQQTHAATLCNSPGEWVSADVYVQVLNPDGSLNHISNNFDFNVQTTDPSGYFHIVPYAASFWDQSILDQNGTALGANVNVGARPSNVHPCLFGLPAYDFTDGTNGNYVLNCLWGVDHAHSVGFHFHGISVNDTGGWTGHWVTNEQDKEIDPTASGFLGPTSDLNKQQYTIILQYQLDNSPPVTPTVSAVCNGTTSELNISWAGSSTGSAGGFSVDVSAPNNPAHTANNYYSKAVGTATSTTAPNGFNLWPGGAPAMPALVPGATYYVWVWNGISSPPTSVVANSCTPPPTVSLLVKGSNDAAPTTTPNPILVGGTIALTWSSTNATSCTASDQWAGTPIGTSQAYPPGQDRTPDSATPGTKKYTITCSGPGGNSPPATVTINVIPPATATLTAAGPDGSNIVEVNDPVTVTWTSQNATSCSSGGQWAGTAVNPLNGGSVTRPSDTTTTGTKTYTLTCSNSVSSVGPIQATIAVAVKPYVRTYGGDVESGAAFKDSSNNCSINNNAGIIAYNKGSNAPPNAGAGVQYLAQSYSSIYQFASAALRASVPAAPFGLSPDNTNAPWGGGFGSASCAEDYSNAASTGTAGNSLGGSYTNLTPSTHIILKHTGDIFIDSDVTYQTSGWTSTQIPSFYLIVTGGNIYIKNTVSQLDGVYIAQSAGGKGGTIYTCASGAGSAYLGGSIYDNCSQQLTVNGAFIADQIKFLRSFGSLSNGTQGESPAGSGHNCYASGTVISQPVCAAEIFNYGPELWLNGPGLFPADSQKYDSITGLPPVL